MSDETHLGDRCPRRTDDGPHLPRFPATWLAQMQGFEYSCTYCGQGVTEQGREAHE